MSLKTKNVTKPSTTFEENNRDLLQTYTVKQNVSPTKKKKKKKKSGSPSKSPSKVKSKNPSKSPKKVVKK